MGLATRPGHGAAIVPVVLAYFPQVTADVTDAAVKAKSPVAGTVVGVHVGARAIGGGTPFTDVDVEVLKGATALLSANAPLVDGSVLAAGGVYGSLSATASALRVAVDDVLAIKLIDITGGASSPTLDGLVVTIYIAAD